MQPLKARKVVFKRAAKAELESAADRGAIVRRNIFQQYAIRLLNTLSILG